MLAFRCGSIFDRRELVATAILVKHPKGDHSPSRHLRGRGPPLRPQLRRPRPGDEDNGADPPSLFP